MFFSFLQWRLAQNKLKLDLFDRRYAVYRAIAEHLVMVGQTGTITHEMDANLLQQTRDATFLFDDTVVEFIDEIYARCVDLETLTERGNRLYDDAAREKVMRIKGELQEHLKGLPERLRSFLHLSHDVVVLPSFGRSKPLGPSV